MIFIWRLPNLDICPFHYKTICKLTITVNNNIETFLIERLKELGSLDSSKVNRRTNQ